MTALITRFGRVGISADSVELEIMYDFLVRNDPAIRVVVRFRPGFSVSPTVVGLIETSFAEVPLEITVGGKGYVTGPLQPIVLAAEPPPDLGADGSSGDDDEYTDEEEQYFVMLVIAFAVLVCVIVILTVRARRRNRKALGMVLATPVPVWGDKTEDFTATPAPPSSATAYSSRQQQQQRQVPAAESMQQGGGHYYPGGSTTFNATPIDADYLAFNDAPNYMDPTVPSMSGTPGKGKNVNHV